MIPSVTHLLPVLPDSMDRSHTETVEPILHGPSLRLEHIVSHGQSSPPGFWYDQPHDEWVMLLRGTAVIDFGADGLLNLNSGDSLTIAAFQKHRVHHVSDDAVWIALHLG